MKMLSSLLVLSSQNIVYYDSTLYVTELHVLNSQHSCSPTEIVYPLAYVDFEGTTFIRERKKNKTLPGDMNRHMIEAVCSVGSIIQLHKYLRDSELAVGSSHASFFLFVVLVQNGHEDITNYTQHSESGVILTLFEVLVSLSLVKTSKQDVGL